MLNDIGSGQHISHLARAFTTSSDSVYAAIRRNGAALIGADTKRPKATTAIGRDATLFVSETCTTNLEGADLDCDGPGDPSHL